MLKAIVLLGILCFPASIGLKFDCLYNLGNIIIYGSWSGFYSLYWNHWSTCNRNLTDHGHVLRIDNTTLLMSNISLDLTDITGPIRNVSYYHEWDECDENNLNCVRMSDTYTCFKNITVQCDDKEGNKVPGNVIDVDEGIVNLWSNYQDKSINETYTCDAGHRDVDCKNQDNPQDETKTLTCDITEVPSLNDPPNNVTCEDPFIIIGTDDPKFKDNTVKILSRSYDGTVTEVNNYTHILIPYGSPGYKNGYLNMSDSQNADTINPKAKLWTMANETFMLYLPEGLGVGLPVRKYDNVFRDRPVIAKDPEAAVFTTGNLHRLAIWCRSTNTILGIANTGNLTQIYNTNFQGNLDYIPNSAETAQGLRITALLSVLTIIFNIY